MEESRLRGRGHAIFVFGRNPYYYKGSRYTLLQRRVAGNRKEFVLTV